MRENISDYILTVKAGASFENLSFVSVNNEDCPTRIDSDLFSGYLLVRMKDFNGYNPPEASCLSNPNSDYFSSKQRLYTISIQGTFKQDTSGDDLMFGLCFDQPIKTPPGASLGLRIARWLEPNLEYELNGPQPYMIAPVLTCINYLGVYDRKEFQQKYSLKDNDDPHLPDWAFKSTLFPEDNSKLLQESMSPIERKKHYSKRNHRSNCTFHKSDIVTMEFYDAHFDFNQFRIVLPGFSLNALKYWNGRPIKFGCMSTDRSRLYFVVEFEPHLKRDLSQAREGGDLFVK